MEAGDVSFGAPVLFVLLVVAAGMAYAAWRLLRWRVEARRSFAGPQAGRWPANSLSVRLGLLLAAALLIVVAAARPQWGSREVVRERQGVDLVIVLDISASMLATDVTPNRLSVAQDELARLIEAERGNRYGLVVFAGSAVMRSPLTTDSAAVAQLVRRAQSDGHLVIAGSDLGAALDEARRVFEASESNGRAVLLVSDGEDHPGTYAGKAAQMRAEGIAVYTAGVGTAGGGTIPDTDLRGQPRVRTDAQGNPIVTRLNEESLRSIASQGGGRYLPLDRSGRLLELRPDLAALQQTPLGEEAQKVPRERFQLFVALALLLLAGAWLLPDRLSLPALRAARLRARPGLAVLLLALVLGGCSGGDPVRARNEAANRLFDAGQFEAALQAYHQLLRERPDLEQISVNAGNAQHRLQRYDRAVAETQRALPPTDAAIGAVTFYNLGNHLLALDQLESAYDAYRNALLLDPSDRDAKHNLELTLLLLAQREMQQPGQGPGEGQEPGEQEGESSESAQGEPARGQAQPGGQEQGQPSPEQVQRELAEALRGIERSLTYEEALRILDLLRQQQQQQRPSRPGSSGAGPDY